MPWRCCAELHFCCSHITGWGICTYIVKANDDLRQVRNVDWLGQGVGLLWSVWFHVLVCQEQFAMQLIMQLIDIWDKAGLMTSTISPYRWCSRRCCLLWWSHNEAILISTLISHSESLQQSPLPALLKLWPTAYLLKWSRKSNQYSTSVFFMLYELLFVLIFYRRFIQSLIRSLL